MVSESLGFTNFTHIENEISRDGEYKHNQRFCLNSSKHILLGLVRITFFTQYEIITACIVSFFSKYTFFSHLILRLKK